MKTGMRTGLRVIVREVPVSHWGTLLNRSAGSGCSPHSGCETSGEGEIEIALGDRANVAHHSPVAFR
jgi:hypothetical protein